MEVSNEIKEDIRKTQTDLKNAIRVHQVWVARLRDDEDNVHLKMKVKDAEKEIIAIGQTQKLVVERLRRELELYQQRLKARNKQVNIENDNRYVAHQLRQYQQQYRKRHRTISLLKPVLNNLHVKDNNEDTKENISDAENDGKSIENSNHCENGEEMFSKSYSQLPNNHVHDSRSNFANALKKVKESIIGRKLEDMNADPYEHRSDSESSGIQHSPTPSPPPLPEPGESVTQENFMRLIGLVTPTQKEILKKKMTERKKRSTTSTNRTDFLYGNFDMMPKRKKLNQYPYLQSHNDPPQTRSAKLRKQQTNNHHNNKSREGSPVGSSSENQEWNGNKPAWAASLPVGLTVEPVYPNTKKVCHGCGRNDVVSLLVYCGQCGACVHTGCGGGRCVSCAAPLPEPASPASPASPAPPKQRATELTAEKLAERKRLQERNIELCEELRKLEVRAASLKENLDEHNAEKRQLLADQIKTQRNLQKLLDFISQFKETSLSLRSTSVSESGSELSKSNEE